MDDIQEKVVEVVAKAFGKEPSEIGLDQTWENLNTDSFALVEMVVAIQDKFNIQIKSTEMDSFKTPKQLIDAVTEKTAKK